GILQARRHHVVLEAILRRECVGGAGRRIDPWPRIWPEGGRLGCKIQRVRDRLRRYRTVRCSADAVPMLRFGHPVPVAVAQLGVNRRGDKGPPNGLDSGLIIAKVPHDYGIAACVLLPRSNLLYKPGLRTVKARL